MADNPYERDRPALDDGTDDASAPVPPAAEDAPDAPAPDTSPDATDTAAAPAASPQTAAVPVRTSPEASQDDDAVTSTFDLRDRPGQHQAQRPVPRSGLTERRSAGYLTGELSPPEPVAASPAGSDAGGGHWQPAQPAPPADAPDTDSMAEEPGGERTAVLEGATAVSPRMPSRAGAHAWTVLLTLLLTPVAWYLLADAGARLTLPSGNPWDTANLNIAALLELAGGLLVLTVILLAARWSSVGAIVVGSLLVVVGVPFLAAPAWTQDLLGPVTDWLQTLGGLGSNTAAHLVSTGSTGRFVVYGLALILVGVVSHGARRKGRREMHEALVA